MKIWKTVLKGKNNDTNRLHDWRIEASRDNNYFDMLYAGPVNGFIEGYYIVFIPGIVTHTHIDTNYKKFLIDFIVKYQAFRLFCNRIEQAGYNHNAVVRLRRISYYNFQ